MRWSISSPVVRLIGVDLRNACWVNQAGYQHGSAARKRGSQVLKFRLHISGRKQERTRCYIGLIMDWLLAFSKSGHAFALLLGAWALGAFACTFNEPSQPAPTPGLERTISAATVVAVPTNTLPATPSPDLLLPSLKTKQMLGQPIPSQLGHRKHSLQILLLYPMSTTWMPTLPNSFAAGGKHTCMLQFDGTAVCWGANGDSDKGQADPPPGVSFTAIAAGYEHTCGINDRDLAQCWGDDSSGQSIPPGGRMTHIDAGRVHTCGLRGDGTAACWGSNEYGRAHGTHSGITPLDRQREPAPTSASPPDTARSTRSTNRKTHQTRS